MKKIKIATEINKDKVDKAVEVIKGYCTKHFDCATCRFYNKENYDCVLSKSTPPCDWSVNNVK